MNEITNLKGLKESLIEHKAVLPQHWDDSIIEMRQGDLDEIENQFALLEKKNMRLESRINAIILTLEDTHPELMKLI